jgi:histidinol-phosphatase (PHP family)
MRPELLQDYVDTVLRVRKTYQGKIEIPLGLELEYYPGIFTRLLPLLKEQPMDYLILGQHCLGDEIDDHYSGRATADKRHMERYCDQTIEAMQTGLFTYFAHPDLLNYVGDDSGFYREQVRRICREAKQCGIPLEINLLGMLELKHYPNDRFWEVAEEEGCDVILGRDAHEPEQLLLDEYEQRGLAMVERFGLNLLHTVQLRKPW